MAEIHAPTRRMEAPDFKPECVWERMTPDTPVPKDALYQGVKLNGDDVYIGRVDDGVGFFIGTAIPKKNVCIFLDKNLEVKSSSNYEILTVEPHFRSMLYFADATSDDEIDQLIPAGTDDEKESILYVGRYIDNDGNTYYGWMNEDKNRDEPFSPKVIKEVFIPRDATRGSQVIDKNISVLRHQNIQMMCRGCPTPMNPTGC